MMTNTKKRVNYTTWWIDAARVSLSADSTASLISMIHTPQQGGGWNDEIDMVYREPVTSEESMLQLEVLKVLKDVLTNQIARTHELTDWGMFGKQIEEIFGLAHLIAVHDPVLDIQSRVEIEMLCQNRLRETFAFPEHVDLENWHGAECTRQGGIALVG